MDLQERLSSTRGGEAFHPLRDPFADVKNRIHIGVIDDLGRQIFNTEIDLPTLRAKVTAEIHDRLNKEAGISREDRERLAGELADDILGHGPLERVLADDTVTEIMVNGPFDVWIERLGYLHKTTVRFTD